MADVQLEKGYTRIANQLLEEVAACKFNGTEFRIIMTVWRFTYGFNRKEHSLSTNFIARSIGMDNSRVRKVIKKLVDSNVILVTKEATFNQSRALSFNKNFEDWEVEKDQRGKKEPHQSNTSQPQGSKKTQPQGSKSTPKKESIKDTTTKTTEKSSDGENPFTFYQQNFGVLAPFIAENISKWCEDTSDELVIESMKIALKNGKQFRYSEGILRKWEQNGIKTLADIEADELKHERETQTGEKEYTLEDQIKEIDDDLSLGKEYFEMSNKIEQYNTLLKERERLEQLRGDQRESTVI